jgi:hypothetical protein
MLSKSHETGGLRLIATNVERVVHRSLGQSISHLSKSREQLLDCFHRDRPVSPLTTVKVQEKVKVHTKEKVNGTRFAFLAISMIPNHVA